MLTMHVMTWVKDKVRNRFAGMVRSEVQKAVEGMLPIMPQLIEFQSSAAEDRQSYYNRAKAPFENREYFAMLRDRLVANNVIVEDVAIDIPDFERWLHDFPEIRRHYKGIGQAFVEKCLEHYLAFRHLEISANDVYIDIAAAKSPWAGILNRRHIRSYRLDLAYPKGVHGINIGANAGDTTLPDAFASVLSSQCAFECFMGDADTRFVREAARILNERGRYGIVPLYLDDVYYVATSPYCNQRDVVIEGDARKVWRDDGYRLPFSRHYSPESFKKRIYSNVPGGMTGRVLYFRNLTDLMKRYQGQMIYCFFMFYCEMKTPVGR